MHSKIGKSVLNDHLGSSTDPCYIQNRVITNRVIKRLRCIISWKIVKVDCMVCNFGKENFAHLNAA